MTTLIITILGDDRAGLVEALSGVIARRNGSWVRSNLAELAGKFAGVIEVRVPAAEADVVIEELRETGAEGLLHITVERALATSEDADVVIVDLSLVGQDHPGIVHEVSHALAKHKVSIDELHTETVPAPQGGHLFHARARLEVPVAVPLDELEKVLESIAQDLMVDLDVEPSS